MQCTPRGSAPEETAVAVIAQPVQRDLVGTYFGLAFAPAPSLDAMRENAPGVDASQTEAEFARGLAAQAMPYWSSGAITSPALDSAGKPLPPPAGSQATLRYSCGATLVSPSHVITAGHCVDSNADRSKLVLHQYRPGPELATSHQKATALSGEWPNFSRAQLSAADGYHTDQYNCQIVRSCYEYQADNVRCTSTNSGTDVALLVCDGRPGDKYGYLDAAQSQRNGMEALLHWKHELVGFTPPVPQSFADHYVSYAEGDGTVAQQNYHYFDQQLLPLRSISWADGTPTTVVDNRYSTTDLLGCHGTSGSGILLRRNDTAVFDVDGPVARGGEAMDDLLCAAFDRANPLAGKGEFGLSHNGTLRFWLRDDAATLEADCRARVPVRGDIDDLPFSAATPPLSTIFTYRSCPSTYFTRYSPLLEVSHPRVLGPYPERYLGLRAGNLDRDTVDDFALLPDTDYRFGVHVVPVEPCASDCGELVMSYPGATSARMPVPPHDGPLLLAHLFTSRTATSQMVRFGKTMTNGGVGGFVFTPEGRVNSFDTPEDRLETVLYAVDGGQIASGPHPMRFTGDGVVGFMAELHGAERMAFLRQAIAPGEKWTVRLGASSFDGLTCGLLDMKGIPVTSAPCSAAFRMDDSAGTAGRLGFYVERAARSAAPVFVRYVALASSRARDTDGDAVPDVLDRCPNEPAAAPLECAGDSPPPVADAGAEAGAVPDEAGAGNTDASDGAVGEPSGSGGNDATGGSSTAGGSGGASASGGANSGGATAGGAPSVVSDASSGDASVAPTSSPDTGCNCRTAAGGPSSSAVRCATLFGALAASGALRRRRTGPPPR